MKHVLLLFVLSAFLISCEGVVEPVAVSDGPAADAKPASFEILDVPGDADTWTGACIVQTVNNSPRERRMRITAEGVAGRGTVVGAFDIQEAGGNTILIGMGEKGNGKYSVGWFNFTLNPGINPGDDTVCEIRLTTFGDPVAASEVFALP